MTQLFSFSPEEAELLISLPYRIGIFVSYTEDEEGEGDDEHETKALVSSLQKFAKSERVPLIAEIARETLKRKGDWQRWSDEIVRLDQACEKAVQTLKPTVSEAELKAYIAMITDIATEVAQAFGEFGFGAEQPKGVIGKIKKIVGGKKDSGMPMNVSAAEDDSIAMITKALRRYAG